MDSKTSSNESYQKEEVVSFNLKIWGFDDLKMYYPWRVSHSTTGGSIVEDFVSVRN